MPSATSRRGRTRASSGAGRTWWICQKCRHTNTRIGPGGCENCHSSRYYPGLAKSEPNLSRSAHQLRRPDASSKKQREEARSGGKADASPDAMNSRGAITSAIATANASLGYDGGIARFSILRWACISVACMARFLIRNFVCNPWLHNHRKTDMRRKNDIKSQTEASTGFYQLDAFFVSPSLRRNQVLASQMTNEAYVWCGALVSQCLFAEQCFMASSQEIVGWRQSSTAQDSQVLSRLSRRPFWYDMSPF
jgi:hypothetical protein